MMQALSAAAIFVLLTGSALLGRCIRPRLPATHRDRDTIEAMQIIIGMLVTFTALVLGLLTTSVKTAYDKAGHDLQDYALNLTQVDRCLRDYGPEAEPARDQFKGYAAALIASTWTSEPPPTGVPYPSVKGLPQVGPSPELAAALNRAYLEIRRLAPADSFHLGLRDDCLADYQSLNSRTHRGDRGRPHAARHAVRHDPGALADDHFRGLRPDRAAQYRFADRDGPVQHIAEPCDVCHHEPQPSHVHDVRQHRHASCARGHDGALNNVP